MLFLIILFWLGFLIQVIMFSSIKRKEEEIKVEKIKLFKKWDKWS